MAKKHLRVGFIREEELVHICYSYSMVKAIHGSLKVINDDAGFINFVRQNYLGKGYLPGGKAAVSAEVANPAELKKRRDEIFKHQMMPILHRAHLDSPAVFTSRINVIQYEKNWMLQEINARYDRVQTANKAISEHLLLGKKVAATMAFAGAGLVCVIGAGYALCAIGTTALFTAGLATAAQVSTAVGGAAQAGTVGLFFSAAHLGVSSIRTVLDMGASTDALVVVGEKATVKVAAAGFEHAASLEHGGTLARELNAWRVAVRDGYKFGFGAFARNIQRSGLIETANKNLMKHVAKSGACGVGILLCAGAELKEYYEQWEEDMKDQEWEDVKKKHFEHRH